MLLLKMVMKNKPSRRSYSSYGKSIAICKMTLQIAKGVFDMFLDGAWGWRHRRQ